MPPSDTQQLVLDPVVRQAIFLLALYLSTALGGVLAFVYYWREFNEPLLYIQSIEKYTLSVGLAYLEQLDPTNWPLLLAGSVVITAPLVVVFLIAQPFFLEPLERWQRPRREEPERDT